MSFECDELVPVSRGGSPYDPANVDAAHRICNEKRGNKPLGVPQRPRDLPCSTSRRW